MEGKATVVTIGSRRTDYPRDCAWAKFFADAPYDVIDLTSPTRMATKSGGSSRLRRIRNIVHRHFSWIAKTKPLLDSIRNPRIDYVFVYKNNHLLLILCSLYKKCCKSNSILVYDSWISLYLKARTTQQPALVTWMMKIFEKKALSSADRLAMLSNRYTHYYANTFELSQLHYKVPISAGLIWENTPQQTVVPSTKFIYWGCFLEQHGVDTILAAAKLITNDSIRIHIVGDGKLRVDLERKATEENTNNVSFDGFLSDTDLIQLVDSAIACFGHLKPLHDYNFVLPNKAVQSFARGKPIVMINSDQKEHWQTKAETCSPIVVFDGSPRGLAETLMNLANSDYQSPELHASIRKFYDMNFSEEYVHKLSLLVFDE